MQEPEYRNRGRRKQGPEGRTPSILIHGRDIVDVVFFVFFFHIKISWLLPFFFRIGSWFNHWPNSCHRETDTKFEHALLLWRKVLPTEKNLVVSFWKFQINQA